ncbi:hypothetical protein C8Q80DRAFT_1150817 [Daedaleopsis nitida]|nr:hypothetical protein C8Q80DRAFT_1150817 [Daedaleopsis nitida]
MSSPSSEDSSQRVGPQAASGRPQECLTCRIIGTAALGGVGVYALNQSRAHAPGSVVGKRILAGVGVAFLVASAFRWTK